MLPNLEALWWASDPVLMRFHRFRYKGGGASPQHETRNQIGRNSLTLLECSLGIRYVLMARPRAQKIRRASSGGGKFRGDFLVRETALPHIDPCGSRHLAVSTRKAARRSRGAIACGLETLRRREDKHSRICLWPHALGDYASRISASSRAMARRSNPQSGEGKQGAPVDEHSRADRRPQPR